MATTIDTVPTKPRSTETERRIKVLQKFVRMARKVFRFSDNDLKNCGLKDNRDWEWIREQLVDCGLLVRHVKQARQGPSSEMLHLTVRPELLLSGESGTSIEPKVRQFWGLMNNGLIS